MSTILAPWLEIKNMNKIAIKIKSQFILTFQMGIYPS